MSEALERVGVWGEEGFSVGHCEGIDGFGGDFGGGGGGGGDGIGDILFGVGEPVGCLFCEGSLRRDCVRCIVALWSSFFGVMTEGGDVLI